ncbi:MAG: hypothetical protein A2Z13_03815 [Deltaproteobacteria bacterium RBG_16_64_85]|nr:MAG: hypothetical protein A2Z13_03815 [Deltaproteobacteria bacterium RBG_16_64_85]
MASRKTILVTGATGRQGGAVARCLLSKGQKVRIMTRTPEKAREWGKAGAEVVRGAFDDYRSLEEAVKGVQGVFLMGTPFEADPGTEVDQGRSMVYACQEAGVPHLVYSSVCGADKDTAIPHFDSKFEIEEYIRETGLPSTILRPVFFMENFESPWMRPSLEDGELSLPLSPQTNLQMICVNDIGEFAAEAFLDPERFLGEEIDLAGDERRIMIALSEISCTMNHPIRYERMPEEKAEEILGYDLAEMYRWLDEVGYDVDIERLRGRYWIRLTPFSRYLGKSGLYRKAA